jgi:hypothetical protein
MKPGSSVGGGEVVARLPSGVNVWGSPPPSKEAELAML